MPSSLTCPSDEELLAVAAGEEPADDSRHHLAGCPMCRERLENLRGELAQLQRAVPKSVLSPSTGSELRCEPRAALLFGLLALKNGLVDQDQLIDAVRAWVRADDCVMADILIARGYLDNEQRALLDGLVALQLRKHGGSAERILPAQEGGGVAREALAKPCGPEGEATLTHDGPGSTETDRTGSYAVGASTSDGQRFRVLRPHARGGLGAVFVAHDAELNREVALKQIHTEHADDPRSRARFLLEAEVTGRLEHPGIVPVYGLGYDRDGHPFYVMRLVRGDNLKDTILRFHAAEGPSLDPAERARALRELLGRFVDVCNAVGYAHSRGIIHRDLKPSNILLGPYGETLVVDWGLAKLIDCYVEGSDTDEIALRSAAVSGSTETQPGSIIGTPAYMSPEQSAGRVDLLSPASDIYSLGTILYCILTGRSPFEGTEVGQIPGKVQRGEFTPPSGVDRTIDPDLEAICLKAMALDPADRHPSARQLVDDIERWLASDYEKLQEAYEELQQVRQQLETAVGQLLGAKELAAAGNILRGVSNSVDTPIYLVSGSLEILQKYVVEIHDLLMLYKEADPLLEREQPGLLARIRAMAESVGVSYTLENLEKMRARTTKSLGDIRQKLADFPTSTSNEGHYDVDLNDEIISALNLLSGVASRKRVRIDLKIDRLPKVLCCPAKIGLVVINLVTNAIEASCEGGVVTVRTQAEAQGVRIEVADSGSGIDPAIHHRIFDPFFTTKATGQSAGLGLSLCHGIILDHGGTIEFSSAPGQGSCFTVRLPSGHGSRSPVSADRVVEVST
jgi:serine/threonine protein kinase